MAIIFPRAVRTDTTIESQSVTVPSNGKSYDVFAVPFNFTNPAQGLRNELLESVDGGQTWTVATSNPPITEANPNPFVDGGLDRFGQQKRVGLYGLTGVAGRLVKSRFVIRGSIDFRVEGTVNTG
jgi:hypothetical protein